MITRRLPVLLTTALTSTSFASTFEAPVRLTAEGQPISVSSPGYACPTVADVDGDGSVDLVVGQFAKGSMKFYQNTAAPGETPVLAKGEWLTTDDKPIEMPGVW